jgi:hypothetical protein
MRGNLIVDVCARRGNILAIFFLFMNTNLLVNSTTEFERNLIVDIFMRRNLLIFLFLRRNPILLVHCHFSVEKILEFDGNIT